MSSSMSGQTPYAGAPSDPAANTETVRAFLARFWDAGEGGAADALLAPDYVDHAYTPPTRAGLEKTAAELSAAFTDRRTTVEDVVAAEDKVVARLTLRMTHTGPFRGVAPAGTPVTVTAYRMYRLAPGADGRPRIAEHWALLDTTSLLRQIGAPPAGAPPPVPRPA